MFSLHSLDFLPEAIPSVITILPEENEVCFTAVGAIVDDATALEATVSFSLKIDQVEPFDMARVIIGRDTLKVSIVDDDGKQQVKRRAGSIISSHTFFPIFTNYTLQAMGTNFCTHICKLARVCDQYKTPYILSLNHTQLVNHMYTHF